MIMKTFFIRESWFLWWVFCKSCKIFIEVLLSHISIDLLLILLITADIIWRDSLEVLMSLLVLHILRCYCLEIMLFCVDFTTFWCQIVSFWHRTFSILMSYRILLGCCHRKRTLSMWKVLHMLLSGRNRGRNFTKHLKI